MKKILLVPIILLSMKANGQNLVPNPSFEDTINCPIGLTQIGKAVGWSSYRLTPDYFNSCNSNQVGVPSNIFGFQFAHTGNAYGGLTTHAKNTMNFREIIGIQLFSALLSGNTYFVSFYVTRVGNISNHNNDASNKLGVRFSTVPYSSLTPLAPINNFAHVYTDSIISDTLNWVEVKGFFTADSAYQYLSIGNFFSDSLTAFVSYDTSSVFAYYFIDDISVIDSTTTGLAEIGNYREIRVFPNFFRDELNVEGKDFKTVSIFDSTGRICFEKSYSNSPLRIDTRYLTKGVYFIAVTTPDGKHSQKLVKQ